MSCANCRSRKVILSRIADNLSLEFVSMLDRSFRHCTNCENFDESERCVLAGKRPPAEVIVNACEGWVERIPF